LIGVENFELKSPLCSPVSYGTVLKEPFLGAAYTTELDELKYYTCEDIAFKKPENFLDVSHTFRTAWVYSELLKELESNKPAHTYTHTHTQTYIYMGPCHHGMARPQVADRGTASDKEGSCE